MRIVIDLQACQNGSRLRGIGRYALNLTKAMLARPSGHEFYVLLSGRFPDTIDGVRDALDGMLPQHRIVVFEMPDRTTAADPDNAWRNRAAEVIRHRAIEHLRPDLVFVPSLFEGFWDDTVVSVEAGSYLTAVTLHDLIPLAFPEHHLLVENDRDAYYRKLQNLTASDLVLAVSSFVKEDAVKRLSLSSAKIVHTMEGVDDTFRVRDRTPGDRADLCRRYGIARPFVLNTSPFEFRKNIDGMIAGFAGLSPGVRRGLQLVIVGKMDAYARGVITRQARAEGLADDDVVLAGFVSDEDLAALYGTCELFVFPSLNEGFGLPALEAMACGAAVVGSNCTSIPEVIGREDALFDPREPSGMAATMERFLTDGERLAGLRSFGLQRAAMFTWDSVAARTVAAFEAIALRRRDSTPPAGFARARPRLALVSPTASSLTRSVAYLRAILPELAALFDITMVSSDGGAVDDPWVSANFNVQLPAWLGRNGPLCDAILHNLDARNEGARALLQAHPGAVMLHRAIDARVAGEPRVRTDAALQRDLFASDGFRAILQSLDGARHADVFGADLATLATGFVGPANDADGSGAPAVPIALDDMRRLVMREQSGLVPADRLIVALVASEAEAAAVTAAFRHSRAATRPEVSLVVHVAELDSPVADRRESPPPDRTLPGRLRLVFRPLDGVYVGLLAAADWLLISSSYSDASRRTIGGDARANGLPIVSIDLAEEDNRQQAALTADIDAMCDTPPPRISANRGEAARAAAATIRDRLQEIVARSEHARYRATLSAIPPTVRGVGPSSDDVAGVVRALVRNETLGQPPRVLLDVTAWAVGPRRQRMPAPLRAFFASLVASECGARVEPVFFDGSGFVAARQYFAKLIGLPFFAVADARLSIAPGDRIVTLDTFTSDDPAYRDVLLEVRRRGAAHVVLAVEHLLLQRSDLHASIAALAAASITALPDRSAPMIVGGDDEGGPVRQGSLDVLKGLLRSDLRPVIICVDPRSGLGATLRREGNASATRSLALPPEPAATLVADLATPLRATLQPSAPDLRYVVTGHVQGTYSLAIINRAVARVLETGFPGRVRLAPVETVPVAAPEHVPASDRPLVDMLVSRPATAPLSEVVISQHYPLLVPEGDHLLALALFAWEESRVPSETIAALEAGFDGVIAPSRFVAKALIDSGLPLPVAAIGQPSDVDLFKQLGEVPRQARTGPRTFLHVSSCFPRKGVDVLLAAWALAFTESDDVRLLIKTFPNPHNTVEADVRALLQRTPGAAPITIINRDLDRTEMTELYRTADVMVLPSRGEGYNLPALEAMLSGIPLIVTGYGGHSDFCGPEEARFLDYGFGRSGSHVSGGLSLWIEPSREDLVRALREQVDPGQRDSIEARRRRARDAGLAACDEESWLLRLQAFAVGLASAAPADPRVAWVTTWQVKCGIAQYSDYLLQAASEAFRRNAVVICDMRTAADAPSPVRYKPTWRLGQETDTAALVDAIESEQPDLVVLQHQDGLISWENLAIIINRMADRGIASVVTLHNVRNLVLLVENERDDVVRALARISRVLVHSLADVNSMTALGLAANTTLFPHGAIRRDGAVAIRPLRPETPGPIIGCHGFFLPHKGIDKLIRAAAELRRHWPNLRLRLVNARFPQPVSDNAIVECERLAAELKVADLIEWKTDFLPIDDVTQLLAGCDLLVLPYDQSNDSASGAARVALASLVPVLASRVRIFEEFEGVMASYEDDGLPSLVAAIDGLLRDPERRKAVQSDIIRWLDEHDWTRVVATLEGMLKGLAANTQDSADG